MKGLIIFISVIVSIVLFQWFIIMPKNKTQITMGFYQLHKTQKVPATFMTVPSGNHPMMVKEVYDPYGDERYVKPPGAPDYIQKHVSAPCFSLSENVLVFDLYKMNL